MTESRLNGVHVDTPVFPICVKAENGATLKTGSWAGGSIGRRSLVNSRPFAFPNTLLGASPLQGQVALLANQIKTLAVFRSKEIFSGKVNNIKAELTGYAFSVDTPAGNVVGQVAFQIVKVLSLSGAGTWVDISTNNSSIEYDHTANNGASVSVTAGIPILNEMVPYAGANRGGSTGATQVDAQNIGGVANRGDMFAIVAKELNGNAATVRFSINHKETF